MGFELSLVQHPNKLTVPFGELPETLPSWYFKEPLCLSISSTFLGCISGNDMEGFESV